MSRSLAALLAVLATSCGGMPEVGSRPAANVPLSPTISESTPTSLPIVEPTPLPYLVRTLQRITPDNLQGLRQVALFGKGFLNDVVWLPAQERLIASTLVGFYFYNSRTYQLENFVPSERVHGSLSPDGRFSVYMSAGGGVGLTEVATGKALRELTWEDDYPSRIAFSSDGRILLVALSEEVKFIDIGSGNELRTIKVKMRFYWPIESLALSPDAQTLVVGTEDGTLRFFDLQAARAFRTGCWQRSVSDVAFSPDGRKVAAACDDGSVSLWDVATAKRLNVIMEKNPSGGEGVGAEVSFSPDGSLLATGQDGTGVVKLWDSETGKELAELVGVRTLERLDALKFSPDGSLLVHRSAHGIQAWDVSTRKPVPFLPDHSYRVRSITVSPRADILATATSVGTIQVWEIARAHLLASLPTDPGSVWNMTFSQDGRFLAAGAGEAGILLWDVGDLQTPPRVFGRGSWPYAVVFSADGTMLASTNGVEISLWDVSTGEAVRTLETHPRLAARLAFSPDGETLATGNDDYTLSLYSVKTGAEMQRLQGHAAWVSSVAFSPDGSTVASTSRDNSVKVWDASTGAETLTLQSWGRPPFDYLLLPLCVAFSPEGDLLAAGSDEWDIVIWTVADGAEVRILEGHSGDVEAVAFSEDGRALFSGSSDGTVRMWGIPYP